MGRVPAKKPKRSPNKTGVWEEAPMGRPRLRWRDNIIKDLVILLLAGVDQ